ncbi:DNA adenine methylase [Yoonia sp. F2084L]|uniref:DNA adenine methylase n=1 Tax=Yoonia sp. F2084L TaxID=2926419 RepID=UPI001FF6460F|nr:DNA adenine methylase [Yoonia sp. F2084L]MCK0096703.1 DNA adenine methylase [Yoonia sp. F2084L]
MARTASPLRYPGGKSCLEPLITRFLKLNRLELENYAEPYAGGGGLALSLLFSGKVSDIHLNDVDPAIWAFWWSALNEPDEFCYKIDKTPVCVPEWHIQREIFKSQDLSDPLSLGFSAFYLNRTNRSGIIKDAGVIGGLDQRGNYKIDCRFNREGLANRIRRIAKYRDRIHLTRRDALDFLQQNCSKLPEKSFVCIDPPYFKKGSSLYTSFYNPDDHAILANAIVQIDRPWVVTYDQTPEITKLYRSRRQYSFDINYSVETKRKGTEVLIVSKGLKVPSEIRDRQINIPQYRAA